jgi:cell division septum initiation protein DivIVA
MTAEAASTAGGAAKDAARATGRGSKRAGEVFTGTDIRRLDEFTDAITRVVVGLHQENTDLKERVARLEAVVAEWKGC